MPLHRLSRLLPGLLMLFLALSLVPRPAFGGLGPLATPTAFLYLPLIVRSPEADLAITKTDGLASAAPGGVLTYTLVVSNLGPAQANGARVTDSFPAGLGNVRWTCSASPGASCGQASGTGNLSATVSLTPTAVVTFTAAADISLTAAGQLVNTASVAPPAGTGDGQTANNQASDTTSLLMPPPDSAGWLAYLNYHRAIARLTPLIENTSWSDGAYKHSRYMVKTDTIAHSEDSTSPYYTPEGNQAAQNSNVMVSSSIGMSDNNAVNTWLRGPFHSLGILDPELVRTGFGSYREAIGTWQMGATLDVLRGLSATNTSNVTFPIKWPGDGMAINLRSYDGGEYPDPLTHSGCAGYSLPTGLPIILQLGSGSLTPVVEVANSSFTRSDGQPTQFCAFSEADYVNPDDSARSLGRAVLNARDAVVLIPRYPLQAGGAYTASLRVSGQTYTWTFHVTSTPSAAVTSGPVPMIEVR